MKSIARDVIGINILSIRSRIQAPAALNSRFAVAIAAGDRDDALDPRAAFLLENSEALAEFPTFPHEAAEPHGVLERQRCTLSRVRARCMRNVADQECASA